MRLLISLPVHESRRVVEDQLRNLRHFLRDPLIVLHVSRSFTEDPDFSTFPKVLVNPQRLATRWGNIGYLHYSNVEFALRSGLEWDFTVRAASNELYVRSGLEEYIGDAAALFDPRGTLGPDGEFEHFNPFLAKAGLNSLARSGLVEFAAKHHGKVCNAPTEGSGYRRDAIEKMHALVRREFADDYIDTARYSTEESLFPTTFLALWQEHPEWEIKLSTCCVDWRYELTRRDWRRIVRHLAGRKPSPWVARYLDDVELSPDCFSIKPVPRWYDAPLRRFIRDELLGGFTLSAQQAADYRRLDREYYRRERKAYWKSPRRWMYSLMDLASRLLGQRGSFLRFDVLETYRRRRRRNERMRPQPCREADTQATRVP